MKKLHIESAGRWLPVFCHSGGRIITCQDSPSKALPTRAAWGPSDLSFFQSKFANENFQLKTVAGAK